jgi:hypothetical protein
MELDDTLPYLRARTACITPCLAPVWQGQLG